MNAPPSPALQKYTGYLLRLAYVKSVGEAQACIPADAHIREVSILSILAEQGSMSQRALGEVTHVNRSLIVKLVDGLEAKGWVVRERNLGDRRSYALKLTEVGDEALVELNIDLDKGEAELTAGLTPEEVARLKGWLCELLVDDPALTVTSLTDRAGYLITHSHHRVRGWAAQALEPLGLHPRDFGVLMTIAREEPCSQSHLAAALGVSSPAVLGFLGDLESLGYVSRSRNTDDRRLLDLTLTEAGRGRLAKAREALGGVHARMVAQLGEDGDNDLRVLLAKLLA
ncbi:MAG: MarR family transcriptional regulator [Nocardioidaceae bacterium]|nr:MarR family transcriptional regulator [Nocardioidaceae bacterium]